MESIAAELKHRLTLLFPRSNFIRVWSLTCIVLTTGVGDTCMRGRSLVNPWGRNDDGLSCQCTAPQIVSHLRTREKRWWSGGGLSFLMMNTGWQELATAPWVSNAKLLSAVTKEKSNLPTDYCSHGRQQAHHGQNKECYSLSGRCRKNPMSTSISVDSMDSL